MKYSTKNSNQPEIEIDDDIANQIKSKRKILSYQKKEAAYFWSDNKKKIYLLKMIFPDKQKWTKVVHIDGNSANFCRNNLMLIPCSVKIDKENNLINDKYLGVYYVREYIMSAFFHDGNYYYGGYFATEKEAAEKYNQMVIKYGFNLPLNKIII